MHTYCTGWPTPHLSGKKAKFSYGNAFTFGDGRLYIRSYESIICVSR